MIDLYEQPDPSIARRRVLERTVGIIAALLLVVGVVAAAVGKDDSTSAADAVGLLGAAPEAAREAGTARMTISSTMSGVGSGFSTTGKGLVDFATGNAELTMSFGGQELTMKVLDGALYMNMPAVLALPKPWIKLVIPATAQAQASPFATGSPTAFLDALAGVGEVTEEGRETINGVAATHYAVEVDMQRAIDAVPDDQRADLERTFGTVPQSTRTLPMDVWLSDDGLPIRTDMSFAVGDMRMTTRLDLTDFGLDVDIQPPPADQVLEVKDMAELGTMFGGGQPQ